MDVRAFCDFVASRRCQWADWAWLKRLCELVGSAVRLVLSGLCSFPLLGMTKTCFLRTEDPSADGTAEAVEDAGEREASPCDGEREALLPQEERSLLVPPRIVEIINRVVEDTLTEDDNRGGSQERCGDQT